MKKLERLEIKKSIKKEQKSTCNCKVYHPKVGEKVAVIRSDDPGGWYDGKLKGIVINVFHNKNGGISYNVKVEDGAVSFCKGRGDVRSI